MFDERLMFPMGPNQSILQQPMDPYDITQPILQQPMLTPYDYYPPSVATDAIKYASVHDSDFTWALGELKDGSRLTRDDWHEGTFIVLIDGSKNYKLKPNGRFSSLLEGIDEERVDFPQHIVMYIGHKNMVVDWIPTQLDILADDWEYA